MSKTPEMEKALDFFTRSLFGRSRSDALCVTCGSTKINPEDFNDDLSRKEFEISRMCQVCQDGTFTHGR